MSLQSQGHATRPTHPTIAHKLVLPLPIDAAAQRRRSVATGEGFAKPVETKEFSRLLADPAGRPPIRGNIFGCLFQAAGELGGLGTTKLGTKMRPPTRTSRSSEPWRKSLRRCVSPPAHERVIGRSEWAGGLDSKFPPSPSFLASSPPAVQTHLGRPPRNLTLTPNFDWKSKSYSDSGWHVRSFGRT
jgi:hypothetical protein